MFRYTSPSVGGATLTASYTQADTTRINSQTSWAIAFSPEAVDGLTVGYAVQEDDGLATVVDDMSLWRSSTVPRPALLAHSFAEERQGHMIEESNLHLLGHCNNRYLWSIHRAP